MTELFFAEQIKQKVALAVLLRDGYTGKPKLTGDVSVSVAGVEVAYRKPLESTVTFLSSALATFAPVAATRRQSATHQTPSTTTPRITSRSLF